MPTPPGRSGTELQRRSTDDLRRLFGQSKLAGYPLEVRTDHTGVQLFAVAQKHGTR